MIAWYDRPVPLPVWRLFLFARPILSLWAAPAILLLSFIDHGHVTEFSAGGATAVAVIWAMAKIHTYFNAEDGE